MEPEEGDWSLLRLYKKALERDERYEQLPEAHFEDELRRAPELENTRIEIHGQDGYVSCFFISTPVISPSVRLLYFFIIYRCEWGNRTRHLKSGTETAQM